MDWKKSLLVLRDFLVIAHHVPGRIRVRLLLSALPKLTALDLDPGMLAQLPNLIKGITEVRINKVAGTAVISYQPDVFAPSVWSRLLEGEEQEAQAILEEFSIDKEGMKNATS